MSDDYDDIENDNTSSKFLRKELVCPKVSVQGIDEAFNVPSYNSCEYRFPLDSNIKIKKLIKKAYF